MKKLLCLMLLVVLTGSTALAANHTVEFDGYFFNPSSLSIVQGDTVFFVNDFPGNSIIVGHQSGPCPNWSSGIIVWNSWFTKVFNCDPGIEVVVESYWTGATIPITINLPPTPNPTPAVSPAGIGLLLLLMGGLLIPAARRRK
ncbi:hypothetical protein JW905_18695 [bacterium]|nr:hypothetical protein [candidate division CSSED10-310 bacterium]